MFELYTRFFDYLAERTRSIRQTLGPESERFALLLNGQPELSAPDLGRKFEKYLKDLIRFGLNNAVIDPEFISTFEESGVLKPTSVGYRIVLDPRPSELKLTTRNIAQMRRLLKVAGTVALGLETADVKPPDVQGSPLVSPAIGGLTRRKKSRKEYYVSFGSAKSPGTSTGESGGTGGLAELNPSSGIRVPTLRGGGWVSLYGPSGSGQPAGRGPSGPSKRTVGPSKRSVKKRAASAPHPAPAPDSHAGGGSGHGPSPPPRPGPPPGSGTGGGLVGGDINPPGPGDGVGNGPDTAEGQTTARSINVTGHKLNDSPVARFSAGVNYKLKFNVGSPAKWSIAEGDTEVKDVSPGGLNTHWVVSSTGVTFVSEHSSEAVKVQKKDDTWRAEFDLLIPELGESVALVLGVIPGAGDRTLHIDIYAVNAKGERDQYRELSVRLSGGAKVVSDVTWTDPRQTHLGTPHEWTTPALHIQISINRGWADVTTKRAGPRVYEFSQTFAPTPLIAAIGNVRASLEDLRQESTSYFDDVDAVELATHLRSKPWYPYLNSYGEGWGPLPCDADDKHKAAFANVQASYEWQKLASDGYALYENCFPKGTELRKLLETMPPGSRIDFHWTEQSGPGWISHVPWALMYMEPVGGADKKLADAEKFFGLRFRIGTRSWNVTNGSRAMGDLDISHAMNLLYWGDKPTDEVAPEARWQDAEYSMWKWSTKLPVTATGNLKQQLVEALDRPSPPPVAVLYFYCHCTVGEGQNPCLRFGNTAKREDTLSRFDLRGKLLPDAPLVFANACTTAQADPYMTSVLEETFFQRGIRAFIGTETKVPIQLASKFAWLYFQFLYRRADPEGAPMAAGEALTQARIFLWTQFRNVGGLFYSMTNQYELFLASEDEVLALPH